MTIPTYALARPAACLMTLCTLVAVLTATAVAAPAVLVLAGGGSEGDIGDTQAWSASLYAPLVEEAPAPAGEPVQVVILASSPQSQFLPDYLAWLGSRAGLEVQARNVIVANRADAENPALVGDVGDAHVVFLKGGDQGRYYDAWNDTLLESGIREVANRGGTLGGTSAGAMAWASHCLCGRQDIISSDLMADAHHPRLDDAGSPPGTSGIHDDFLGQIPAFVDTHYTERGRLGRLLGVFGKAHEDSNGEAVLAIGLETSTGIVVRGDRAEVIGEGAISFVTTRPQTGLRRVAGEPLQFTDLRLDRLTQGWTYDLATREPDLASAPADTQTVSWPGPGVSNAGALLINGARAGDDTRFEWVASYYPDAYALTRSDASRFVRDALGHADVDRSDDLRGDRQATLFRALYDRPELSAFALFGPLSGETTQGSRLARSGANADALIVLGDMSTLLVDGASMTHRGLAPEENFYAVRSAALVNLTVHALAPTRQGGLLWNSRTHTLIARPR